jgi:hypothetical protein
MKTTSTTRQPTINGDALNGDATQENSIRLYRIYYAERGFRDFAGMLFQVLPYVWKLRFRNGYQLYLPHYEGTFEECVTYLHSCFEGVLTPVHTD